VQRPALWSRRGRCSALYRGSAPRVVAGSAPFLTSTQHHHDVRARGVVMRALPEIDAKRGCRRERCESLRWRRGDDVVRGAPGHERLPALVSFANCRANDPAALCE